MSADAPRRSRLRQRLAQAVVLVAVRTFLRTGSSHSTGKTRRTVEEFERHPGKGRITLFWSDGIAPVHGLWEWPFMPAFAAASRRQATTSSSLTW